jgi:outer membrane protein assembly factor BamB
MNNRYPAKGVMGICVLLLAAWSIGAQDWPQWRGPNRDGHATGFTAPKSWPKELTKKWTVGVGLGVASPSLVGDKLYVFVREGGDEVLRCLDAATGKQLWQEKYEAPAVSGIAAGRAGEFVGPRATPTVADGKVVTLGARGILSCFDAASGKKLWRNEDFKGVAPQFSTASSPIVVDGMCIAQLGSESKGGIIAFDLAGGTEKWKWTGDGPGYGSPVLLTLGDSRLLVTETAAKIVALGVADGKLLWETPFPAPRGGRTYNSCTPVVDGQTVIYSGSGRGTKAIKFTREGDSFSGKELWSSKDDVLFNTPVLKNGLLFGLSARDSLFCINLESGKTAWTAALGQASTGGGGGGGGGGGRGGGNAGFASIVDAGSALMVLMPNTQLTVFEPSDKEFRKLATYKVGDKETFAYPILAGNRIFVKDRDSLTLWTLD